LRLYDHLFLEDVPAFLIALIAWGFLVSVSFFVCLFLCL
jgi:hypothetical protein